MLYLRNDSDKLLVVLHEIYGINQFINDICLNLFNLGFDVICPNLLNRDKPFDYSSEDVAYMYFINNVGFSISKDRVINLLRQYRRQYKKQFILGYSIGATIAWLCSEEEQSCDGIIGYYGSRIRDYIEVTPKCPALLFFPDKEKSFNVRDLVEILSSKSKTVVYQVHGEHGFCNPYTEKYLSDSNKQTYNLMINFINNIP